MRRRSAFTLVELLVTMALIIFIMALLSEAFVVGLQTFRDLKAIGDMDDRLRAATSQIRDDLQADHFGGKGRLSDPNFWAAGPPNQGFLRIYAPTTPAAWTFQPPRPASFLEGVDGDGIQSAVVTDMILHLSVKQRANHQERFFSAGVPPNSPLLTLQTTNDLSLGMPDARYQDPNGTSYSSPWAETAYFLVSNGETAGSTPLFTLYRAQYVVTPDNAQLNYPANSPPFPAAGPFPTGYAEMSCECLPVNNPTQIYFNSPTDLAGNLIVNPPVPPRRVLDYSLPPLPVVDPSTNLPRGSTFVMGDVISFEIQVLTPGSPSFQYVQGNFDTSSSLTGTITAIQITLRVWDKKTLQTRQITIVQDM
jgi:type II secretory pathway pseudopilin PulG